MNREERAISLLNERALDAVLLSDAYNMHYLSGAEYEGYFVLSKTEAWILTDSRYTVVAERDVRNAKVLTCGAGRDYPAMVAELAKTNGWKQVGFEDLHLTVDAHRRFAEVVPVTWIPVGRDINRLRMIKDADELARLAEAEHIGDMAFDHVLGLLKPGMTEIEVALALETSMRKNGAENLSFDTIVASGVNGSMPHSVPSCKELATGEFITMDFGCKYKGYCSDMTRTVFMGKADAKQREIYNTVLNAQLAALDALHAGVIGRDIDRVARDIIEAAGYGEYFGHGLGHSVGLFIHEDPRLSPTEDRTIEANVIETVEPGIYIPNYGGVRIEDMVVVTETGHINFAKSPKHLIEL